MHDFFLFHMRLIFFCMSTAICFLHVTQIMMLMLQLQLQADEDEALVAALEVAAEEPEKKKRKTPAFWQSHLCVSIIIIMHVPLLYC